MDDLILHLLGPMHIVSILKWWEDSIKAETKQQVLTAVAYQGQSLLYITVLLQTKTRNPSSHTTCSPTPAAVAQCSQQPLAITQHDYDGFCNQVTMTFDLLTSESMRSERLSESSLHVYQVWCL